MASLPSHSTHFLFVSSLVLVAFNFPLVTERILFSKSHYCRETISYTASQLVLRQRRMLNDLMDIYVIDVKGLPENRLSPLPCVCLPAVTIAGLHLPDAITSIGKFLCNSAHHFAYFLLVVYLWKWLVRWSECKSARHAVFNLFSI